MNADGEDGSGCGDESSNDRAVTEGRIGEMKVARPREQQAEQQNRKAVARAGEGESERVRNGG